MAPAVERRRTRVAIDGAAYALSPYGGLLTYWDEVLPRLEHHGIDVDLRLPGMLRARPPALATARTRDAPSAFVSTYFTSSPPRLPSVVVVHDLIYEVLPYVAEMAGDGGTVLRKQSAIRHASTIVTPSRATADGVRQHYPQAPRPLVVPHGMRSALLRDPTGRSQATASSLIRRAGVRRPFALHVGGRTGYKNGLVLLRTFREDIGLATWLDLVFVGSESSFLPAEREELEATPKQRWPKLLGHVDTDVLACLYRRAKVVVSASTIEGFGLPIFEAIGVGTPVACSDITAYREQDLNPSSYFDPLDTRSIARAIVGAAGRTKMQPLALRTWDDSARGLAEALKRAATDE